MVTQDDLRQARKELLEAQLALSQKQAAWQALNIQKQIEDIEATQNFISASTQG